jgi:hypothetical protein
MGTGVCKGRLSLSVWRLAMSTLPVDIGGSVNNANLTFC